MHHRVAYFHACGPAIDQHPPGAAFQHRQQGTRVLEVGVLHLQRDRELAFEPFQDVAHRREVAAADQQRGCAEHLLPQRLVGDEAIGIGGEQRRPPLIGTARDEPACQLLDAGMARQPLDPALVGAENRGREHDARRCRPKRLAGGLNEGFEIRPLERQHEAGIGAELASSHGERTHEPGADRGRPCGQRCGQQDHGIDAAHLRVHRDRLGPPGGNAHQGESAAARAGETHGLDARVRDQRRPERVVCSEQQGKYAFRHIAGARRRLHDPAHQLRCAGMSRVRLDHDGASRGQCRCRVATRHRKGEREIAGTEHGHRPECDVAQAQIHARQRPAVGLGGIHPRIEPATVAYHAGEQAQLTGGAGPLALDTPARQPGLGGRAFDQRVTDVLDAGGDRFEKPCPLLGGRLAIGVERGPCERTSLLDLRSARVAKTGLERLSAAGVDGVEPARTTGHRRPADQ